MSEQCVGNGVVVAFSYVLKDEAGEEIERSGEGEPTVYLHGRGNIMRGIEEALAGKAVGDEVTVTLPPERAYGVRNEEAFQRVPIKHLMTRAKRYQPGMVVQVNTKEGARSVVIVKVGKFNVDVDLNHPLAGKTVTFDITVEQLREASAEERAHGHAHGIDGDANAH